MEITIAILAIFIGLIIGVLHSREYEEKLEKMYADSQQSLKRSPVVIECELGQQLTLDQMERDVVAPHFAVIRQKLGKGLQTLPPLRETAEAMLQWYDPESKYTKLVIVGYLRGGEIKIAWTWQEQDPIILSNGKE